MLLQGNLYLITL